MSEASPTGGERNGRSVLTEAQVVELRTLYAAGVKPRLLREQFGISKAQVEAIVRGKQWVHVGSTLRAGLGSQRQPCR
jgi:hypothetical protein